MTTTATQVSSAASQPIKSGPIPGIGFQAVVRVVHTVTYTNPGGDTLDLSAIFPSQVYGGRVIAETQDDGGYQSSYVLAASGAPATGVIQMWYVDANNAGDAKLVEVPNATALTAIDGQRWLFIGK